MPEQETFPPPKADRAPTPEEAATADRVARTVDVDRVARHEDEMNELGKNVKGEGEIEPTPPKSK